MMNVTLKHEESQLPEIPIAPSLNQQAGKVIGIS